MKIIVTAKQVPDTNEVKIDPVKGTLIRDGVPSILNPDDANALEADGALISATAGLAVHCAGQARFAVNLLPPSLVAARAEKAKIPFVAAAGASLVAALVLLMLGVNRETDVIVAQRDAVETQVSQLENFDKRVKAAETAFASELEAAQAVGDLLMRRSAALQGFQAVRESLVPGMWIEKWEAGRVTVRSLKGLKPQVRFGGRPVGTGLLTVKVAEPAL